MSWVEGVLSTVSAVVGGCVGGRIVAFRMGRWRQKVEDHLENMENRLSVGDRALESVPVIGVRLEMMLEELRAVKAELREQRRLFVSHEECDRRHQDDD